jgi:hypothetical protein
MIKIVAAIWPKDELEITSVMIAVALAARGVLARYYEMVA